MVEDKNYYSTPPQDIFDDIKKKSKMIWETYDDTFGYASEKIARVESIHNYQDDWQFIVGMFDIINQKKLFTSVACKTSTWMLKHSDIGKYILSSTL